MQWWLRVGSSARFRSNHHQDHLAVDGVLGPGGSPSPISAVGALFDGGGMPWASDLANDDLPSSGICAIEVENGTDAKAGNARGRRRGGCSRRTSRFASRLLLLFLVYPLAHFSDLELEQTLAREDVRVLQLECRRCIRWNKPGKNYVMNEINSTGTKTSRIIQDDLMISNSCGATREVILWVLLQFVSPQLIFFYDRTRPAV